MKVLKKNEIQAQIAREKKQEIDNSIALEKKADMLRRDISSLQLQHQTFLKGMKAQMERELEPLRLEKNDLIFDLENLRKERANLREPLDKEWEQWRRDKIVLTELTQLVNTQSADVLIAQNQVEEDRKSILKDREEIKDEKSEAVEMIKQAKSQKSEADRVLNQAQATSDEKMRELNQKEADIDAWEREVGAYKVGLDAREDDLANRERALKEKERFINDKYETLERTVQRLQK